MFDYAMGTASGYAAFLDPEVNKHFKVILNEWGKVSCGVPNARQLIANRRSFCKLQSPPKFLVNINKAGLAKLVCFMADRIQRIIDEPR